MLTSIIILLAVFRDSEEKIKRTFREIFLMIYELLKWSLTVHDSHISYLCLLNVIIYYGKE